MPSMFGTRSRCAFERLLTRNHVERALIDEVGQHNFIPLVCSLDELGSEDIMLTERQALGTVELLDGTPAQLESVYSDGKGQFPAWSLSPGRILSVDDMLQHLGDAK